MKPCLVLVVGMYPVQINGEVAVLLVYFCHVDSFIKVGIFKMMLVQ